MSEKDRPIRYHPQSRGFEVASPREAVRGEGPLGASEPASAIARYVSRLNPALLGGAPSLPDAGYTALPSLRPSQPC